MVRKSSLVKSRQKLEALSVELWAWKRLEFSLEHNDRGSLHSVRQRDALGASSWYVMKSEPVSAVIRSECRRLNHAIAVCLEPVWVHVAEVSGKPLRSLLADRPRVLRQCSSYLVPLFALQCDSAAGAALARQCLSELPNGFPSAWSTGFCTAGGTRNHSPRIAQVKRLLSSSNVALVDSVLRKRREPFLDLNGMPWHAFSRKLLKTQRLERRLARKHFEVIASRRAEGGPMFSWCLVPPSKFGALRDKFNNCIAGGNYHGRVENNTLRVMAVFAQGHALPVAMVSASWSNGAWHKSESATRMPADLVQFESFARQLPPRFPYAKQALLFNQSIPPKDRALRRSALQELLDEDPQFGFVFVGVPRRTLSECDELRLSTSYDDLHGFIVACENRFRTKYSGTVHIAADDRCFAHSVIRFLNQLPLHVPGAESTYWDVMLGATDLCVALTHGLHADRLTVRANLAQERADDVPRVLATSNGRSTTHWSESVIAHSPALTVGELSKSYSPNLVAHE